VEPGDVALLFVTSSTAFPIGIVAFMLGHIAFIVSVCLIAPESHWSDLEMYVYNDDKIAETSTQKRPETPKTFAGMEKHRLKRRLLVLISYVIIYIVMTALIMFFMAQNNRPTALLAAVPFYALILVAQAWRSSCRLLVMWFFFVLLTVCLRVPLTLCLFVAVAK
jgi:hypothetical protein